MGNITTDSVKISWTYHILIDIEAPTPSKYAAGISRVYIIDIAICSHSYFLFMIGPAPSSVGHIGSLSRRVEPSRMIDFDSIPSPVVASGPNRLPRIPSISSSNSDLHASKSIRRRSLTPTQVDSIIYDSDQEERNVPSDAKSKGKTRAISEESLGNHIHQDYHDIDEHQDEDATQPDEEPMEVEDQSEEDSGPSKNSSKAKAKAISTAKTRRDALTPVSERDEDNVSVEDDIEAGLTAIRDSDEDDEPARPNKVTRKATKTKKAISPKKPKATITKVHGRSGMFSPVSALLISFECLLWLTTSYCRFRGQSSSWNTNSN